MVAILVGNNKHGITKRIEMSEKWQIWKENFAWYINYNNWNSEYGVGCNSSLHSLKDEDLKDWIFDLISDLTKMWRNFEIWKPCKLFSQTKCVISTMEKCYF